MDAVASTEWLTTVAPTMVVTCAGGPTEFGPDRRLSMFGLVQRSLSSLRPGHHIQHEHVIPSFWRAGARSDRCHGRPTVFIKMLMLWSQGNGRQRGSWSQLDGAVVSTRMISIRICLFCQGGTSAAGCARLLRSSPSWSGRGGAWCSTAAPARSAARTSQQEDREVVVLAVIVVVVVVVVVDIDVL